MSVFDSKLESKLLCDLEYAYCVLLKATKDWNYPQFSDTEASEKDIMFLRKCCGELMCKSSSKYFAHAKK